MTSRRPLASVWSFIVVSLLMVSSSVTVFLLVKIARAAHVLVRVGAWRNGWCLRRSAVEPALNDGLNGLAMWCALASDRERAEASRVHALSAVFLRTANDAEHRPVAHFGLRILSHRAANDFFDVRPERRGPTDQTLGRPGAVFFMRFRPVLGNRDWSAFSPVASAVRNDTRSAMPQLDDAGRSAQLEVLLAQLVGDAVMAALELHVVVDVCSHLLALRDLETQRRQCPHRWPVDGLERLLTIAFEFLKGPLVELIDELGDGVVKLRQGEERAVAQAREDPTLRYQHADFDLGLALGFSGRGRNHDHVVVLGQIVERLIDVGVVAVRPRNGATKLIGNDDLRRCPEVLQCTHGAGGEVRDRL